MTGPSSRWISRARLFGWVLLVLAVFVGALPRVAGYDEAWGHIRAMRPLAFAVLVLAAAWNLVTYWLVLVVALPGLRIGQAAAVSQASTAVANTLPGGAAWGVGITYSMYRRWGFSGEAIARSVLVTGAWNSLAKLAIPGLAAPLLLLSEEPHGALIPAAVAGLIVLGAIGFGVTRAMRSSAAARRVGVAAARAVSFLRVRLGREPVDGWDQAAVRFRDDVVILLRDRWRSLTIAVLVSHVSLYLVLLAALRATGVPGHALGWSEVLLAFALVRLLLMIPITPGGVGLTELGLTGALIAAGGDRVDVVAAVLVFRALTWLLPILLGLPGYLAWRRSYRGDAQIRWSL